VGINPFHQHAGAISITDNSVDVRLIGIGFSDDLGGEKGGDSYLVARNTVIAGNAYGIGAAGILAVGGTPNAAIVHNHVTVTGFATGISIYGGAEIAAAEQPPYYITQGARGALVGQNTIEGSGVCALCILFTTPACEGNAFIGNNHSRFTSTIADVIFAPSEFNFAPPLGPLPTGANYNTLVGRGGSVLDFGIGNKITGYSAAGGVGRDLSVVMRPPRLSAPNLRGLRR
jgi:hypothetical protein